MEVNQPMLVGSHGSLSLFAFSVFVASDTHEFFRHIESWVQGAPEESITSKWPFFETVWIARVSSTPGSTWESWNNNSTTSQSFIWWMVVIWYRFCYWLFLHKQLVTVTWLLLTYRIFDSLLDFVLFTLFFCVCIFIFIIFCSVNGIQ